MQFSLGKRLNQSITSSVKRMLSLFFTVRTGHWAIVCIWINKQERERKEARTKTLTHTAMRSLCSTCLGNMATATSSTDVIWSNSNLQNTTALAQKVSNVKQKEQREQSTWNNELSYFDTVLCAMFLINFTVSLYFRYQLNGAFLLLVVFALILQRAARTDGCYNDVHFILYFTSWCRFRFKL